MRRGRDRLWWLVLFAVWLASAAYVAHLLLRGWVPHDEGTFGECARRVLAGELPHRDFDEPYTGGLTYLHALAFRLLGVDLASLRVVLFVWFLAWVPAVYWIASRFAAPLTAGGVTLLAVAWSVPNYSAPVPSWYNLFFATFGVAAVLSHLESGSRRPLFVAGLCGGLSVLVKTPGLYSVAGLVLFLLFREQCLAEADSAPGTTRGRAHAAFASAVLMVLVAGLFLLVRVAGGLPGLVQFVLPGAALAAVVLWREGRGVAGASGRRFATLLGLLVPLALGFVLPLVAFALPYAASGSLGPLFRGVFLLPMKRLSHSYMNLPPLGSGTAIVPFLVVLAAAMGPRPLRWAGNAVAAAGLAAVLALSRTHRQAYAFAWHALDLLPPLTVVAGALLVSRSSAADEGAVLRRQQVMLLLCALAFCNLVRFPFSAPIYFCYVAPLVVLAVLAVLSLLERPPRFVLGSLLAFYLLFAVLRFTPGFIHAMGDRYAPDTQTERLTLPRAGPLRVGRSEAAEYERLVPLVQEHAVGEFVYAGPDCPEVYFLSGLGNPGRTMFDFFEEPAGRTERVLAMLDAHRVTVVVLLSRPEFSGRSRELEAALAERFPHSASAGRFQVRWRP